MLNYIWFLLISVGIIFAIATDSSDIVNNKYGSQQIVACKYIDSSKTHIKFIKSNNSFIAQLPSDSLEYQVNSISKLNLSIKIKENSSQIFKEIAKSNGTSELLNLEIVKTNSNNEILVKFPKTSFLATKDVTNSVVESSKSAVNIALGLIGIMTLWLGIMKIAEKSGLILTISKGIKPITDFLFPEIPQGHPALASMIMNISANMLGLGNAATPFGLKAMEELQKLNPEKETASNSMCTFLAINTSGLTLIPATAIAIRTAQGSANPTIIIGTSFIAAFAATFVGVLVAKVFEYFSTKKSKRKISLPVVSVIKISLIIAIIISIVVFIIQYFGDYLSSFLIDFVSVISLLAIPLLILFFVFFGIIKNVKIYEEFVDGAKEGFNVAIRIIPYLVGMIVAISIFRAGGGMDLFVTIFSPITNLVGFPAEVLPMALMRPLSGSGSLAIMSEIMSKYGVDSFFGVLSSTIMGSTETTFYVLAVYFGSVGIRKTRHAVIAGVSADIAGILTALLVVKMLF